MNGPQKRRAPRTAAPRSRSCRPCSVCGHARSCAESIPRARCASLQEGVVLLLGSSSGGRLVLSVHRAGLLLVAHRAAPPLQPALLFDGGFARDRPGGRFPRVCLPRNSKSIADHWSHLGDPWTVHGSRRTPVRRRTRTGRLLYFLWKNSFIQARLQYHSTDLVRGMHTTHGPSGIF